MAHLVLSRKYRPQRFEDLVGQEHVAQTLSNAITSGRIGHAYLFIGPRGTGKTTTARIFAKALNCEKGPTPAPCGECPSCRDVTLGVDLDVVEMDAASNNGVDDVRALRDSVAYRPARSRFRIWIVDEVHMLSLPAFNAFLKTLEEPPPQAKFLFCTTEAHKLPETFTSRVQRLEFRRIDEGRMAERLAALAAREDVDVEPGVCERIASGALGGLRDAESLLEQLLSCAAPSSTSAGRRRVTFADLDAVSGRAPEAKLGALLDAILAGDAAAALDAASACVGEGGKPDVVLDQCLDAFRSMLAEAARPASRSGPEGRGRAFGLPRVARSLDLLLEKRRHLREGADGRLVIEVAAVELARLPTARDLDRLIRALETSEPAVREGPAPREGGRSGASPSASVPAMASSPAPSMTSRSTAVPPFAPSSSPTSKPAAGSAPATATASRSEASPRVASAPPLDAVAAAWPAILRAVEVRSRRLFASLSKATPSGVSGDVVLVSLPDGEPVARSTLRDRETTAPFREASREALGVPLRLALAEPSARAEAAVLRSAEAASRSAEAASRSAEAASRSAEAPSRSAEPAAAAARVEEAGAADRAPARPPPRAATPTPASPARRPAETSDADDLRTNPAVRALIDGFGGRVLAVERAPLASRAPAPDAAGGARTPASEG